MKQQERSMVLSLRLPEKLVKRVDTLAEQELRTRVNMIHVLLHEALERRAEKKPTRAHPTAPGRWSRDWGGGPHKGDLARAIGPHRETGILKTTRAARGPP